MNSKLAHDNQNGVGKTMRRAIIAFAVGFGLAAPLWAGTGLNTTFAQSQSGAQNARDEFLSGGDRNLAVLKEIRSILEKQHQLNVKNNEELVRIRELLQRSAAGSSND